MLREWRCSAVSPYLAVRPGTPDPRSLQACSNRPPPPSVRVSNRRRVCDGRRRFLGEAWLECVSAKSTVLQRERRSCPGGESGAPVASVAPREDPHLPAVRSGLGETLPVCAALHHSQCCVLVSSCFVIHHWFRRVHVTTVKLGDSIFPPVFCRSSRGHMGLFARQERVNVTADSCCFYVMQTFHLSIRASSLTVAWLGYL